MKKVPFVILLFLSIFSSFAQEVVATVDGVKISKEEFLDKLKKWAGETVLMGMIDDILVEKEAKKEGISVSDEEVKMRVDIFRRLNVPPGVDFTQDLLNNGTTLARITDTFRTGLLLEKIIAKREKITVTEDEIKEEFKKVSKERKVRMIIVKSEEDAIALQEKFNEGSFSFAELVEKYSQDPESKAKGGDIGWIRRGMLPPYFEDVIFKLKIGKVSDPIWTRYGFYFFMVEEEREGKLTPELKAELQQSILSAKVGLKRFQLLDELRSKAKIEIEKFLFQ
ncbi:MAG: peptidylprolyl isomerase [bacterium]